MASICISNCVNDNAHVPVRASYVNLYKWPESDAEFVRSNGRNGNINNLHNVVYGHSRAVDSISCRQMYLKSYKFSRKETVHDKTQKCFQRVKDKVASNFDAEKTHKCLVLRKMKRITCDAFIRIFHRFLSCG